MFINIPGYTINSCVTIVFYFLKYTKIPHIHIKSSLNSQLSVNQLMHKLNTRCTAVHSVLCLSMSVSLSHGLLDTQNKHTIKVICQR